jgi:ABC-2 type transport system ATP-binding protein
MNNHSEYAGNAIEVEKLAKKFGDFVAVHGVSFTVPQGEIFGLLAQRRGQDHHHPHAHHAHPPTSGRRASAVDVLRDPDGVRNSIGVIPGAHLRPELGQENLLIHANRVPAKRRPELLRELLRRWTSRVFPVSGVDVPAVRDGAQIARGCVHSPKILFLDDRPPAWTWSRGLKEMIHKLKGSRPDASLTTHYMDEVTSSATASPSITAS